MTRIYKSAQGERAVRERYLEILKRWPVPHQQLRVPTREGETFIIACGAENAPPLLLFHGSIANSAMWMGDIGAWAEHFRIYAVDIIGDAGLSAPSRPPLASEAHAFWLDDVMQALSLTRASMLGVSLGGWLALDYATRRPERVESLVVLCPGGVGRQKVGFVFKLIPLRMMGPWGARKAREMVLGRQPDNLSGAIQYFALIHKNFRPRAVKLPIFTDDALQRLTMPVMAILGGKDVLLDSAETKQRFERNTPHAKIRYYPEAGHFIPGQTSPILEFLRGAAREHIERAGPPSNTRGELREDSMSDQPAKDNEMPVEIDFTNGVRGLHHIPSRGRVLLPISIERSVWEYFSGKAQQKGVALSELVTDVLQRDIEINKALE